MFKEVATTLLLSALVPLFGFDYHLKTKQVSEHVWYFFGALEPPNKKNGGAMSTVATSKPPKAMSCLTAIQAPNMPSKPTKRWKRSPNSLSS